MAKQETILFVHGAWHGAWCWEKYFVPFFAAAGYDCVTFNLPKHDKPGQIKGVNKLSLDDYVEALKTQVQKLDEQPIIIGHSLGGLILQKYLETEPCKKAILLASVPPKGVLGTTLNFLKKGYAIKSLLTFNMFNLVNSPEKAKWAFFSDNLPDHELLEYTQNLCGESFKLFLQALRPNININYHNKIPLLVVAAADDTVISVKDNEYTAQYYDADLLVLENIAHDVMLDVTYQKAARAILNWLKD